MLAHRVRNAGWSDADAGAASGNRSDRGGIYEEICRRWSRQAPDRRRVRSHGERRVGAMQRDNSGQEPIQRRDVDGDSGGKKTATSALWKRRRSRVAETLIKTTNDAAVRAAVTPLFRATTRGEIGTTRQRHHHRRHVVGALRPRAGSDPDPSSPPCGGGQRPCSFYGPRVRGAHCRIASCPRRDLDDVVGGGDVLRGCPFATMTTPSPPRCQASPGPRHALLEARRLHAGDQGRCWALLAATCVDSHYADDDDDVGHGGGDLRWRRWRRGIGGRRALAASLPQCVPWSEGDSDDNGGGGRHNLDLEAGRRRRCHPRMYVSA